MINCIGIGALALALALGACSSNDGAAVGEGADTAQAGGSMNAAEAAKARRASEGIRPQPGLYRSTTEITEFDIPNAPAQVKEMMRNSAVSKQATEYCLTLAEVEKGFEESLRKSQQGDCDYRRFNVSGGTIEAAMTCRQDGRTVDLTLSGKGTRTSSDMAMTMNTDMGPMGKGTIRARTKTERIGDCTG